MNSQIQQTHHEVHDQNLSPYLSNFRSVQKPGDTIDRIGTPEQKRQAHMAKETAFTHRDNLRRSLIRRRRRAAEAVNTALIQELDREWDELKL
ncbi:MAG: hypothetical protein F6J87_02620 [Spirulina sp. SIO3F2]|nr:hypothetical protein [Spirulina sp. SIO3F2]